MKAQLEDTILVISDKNTIEEWTLKHLIDYCFTRIKEFEAKLEFADAGTDKLEGLIHTLRTRIKVAKEYINTLETLFADFGGGTDTHMMAVLDEWEEINKKVGEASAKYYNPPPTKETADDEGN